MRSQGVLKALIRVFLDQLNHSLESVSQWIARDKCPMYLRHQWLAILCSDISERHFCAFVLAELQLGKIDIGNVG